MKYLNIITLTFLFNITNGQNIERYYDMHGKEVPLVKSVFYSVMVKEDSLWHRQDFYANIAKIQMNGFYADSSAKMKEGHFEYYYPSGLMLQEGNYVHNKKQGIWISYYSNKLMADSEYYENGQLAGTELKWHINGMMSDSAVWQTDSSGVVISWFDNGNLSSAGFYRHGKRYGKWKYYHKNGQLSAEEVYNEEKILSRIYYDESGKLLNDTTNKDRKVEFPGGSKEWTKYLIKNLRMPNSIPFNGNFSLTTLISAIIDEEGNVTEVEDLIPIQSAFDDIAIDIMKHSPKWKPCIDHNRKLKSKISQPFTFQMMGK